MEKKPNRDILIVTPVWGSYSHVQLCINAVKKNTHNSYYHILVNDNYKESLHNHIKPNENLAIIDVYNDILGEKHVEQIGKMMDVGLAFGRTGVNWKHFVKLESDCFVNKNWDKILLEELGDAVAIEAYSKNTDGKTTEAQVEWKEDSTYPLEWIEMNCCLFSPIVMNKPFLFSFVEASVDVHLSAYFKRMTHLPVLETTKTHIDHDRGVSRKEYVL